jgi:hypothetical protein
MDRYVSAWARAQLVDALLAAHLALYALRTAGGVVVGLAPDGELARMLLRGERVSQPFLVLLWIVTAVALLAWIDRAERNLPALAGPKPIAPTHGVAALFAPIVNLIAIPYVLGHVWLGSDPAPPRRPWLMVGWCAPLVAAAFGLLPPPFDAALLCGSAACLLLVVRDTQRRQDEQFIDEQRRRSVPLPTADALR